MSNIFVTDVKKHIDRFCGFLEQQIGLCPDELWTKTAGGYPFWQQAFHTFALMEFLAIPEGQESKQVFYPREVVMLATFPEKAMSKAELLSFAQSAKECVSAFIASMTDEKLQAIHPKMSQIKGSNVTNQDALLMLVTHNSYHVGCLDSVLRDNGVKGVY
ncbi:DinB family protein [Desulfovibrio litoralis]|uniref:DinB superfamily protein n=1 Tax=Desulfovibrio litoralis DSM 11393 TaxID=1121455 RepID=A0A1M7RVG6_9BACT|nr:DinB family protein [Desulfovibrio litoralis]SHN50200.1 DinB superfamily protein [Desulfovibrio litoralis DSM 11393]